MNNNAITSTITSTNTTFSLFFVVSSGFLVCCLRVDGRFGVDLDRGNTGAELVLGWYRDEVNKRIEDEATISILGVVGTFSLRGIRVHGMF